MVRDVYAGDAAVPNAGVRLAEATFTVVAQPEPLVVSRIANQLALANVAPSYFQLLTIDDRTVNIAATLTGITREQADLIRRKILQLPCVLDVTLASPQ